MGHWDAEMEKTLTDMWADGAPIKDIAKKLRKNIATVSAKRRHMNLPKRHMVNGKRKIQGEPLCPQCEIVLVHLAKNLNEGNPCLIQSCPFRSYQISLFKPTKEEEEL
jgi:hypothetical protein